MLSPCLYPLFCPLPDRGFNPFPFKPCKEQKIQTKHHSAEAGILRTCSDGAGVGGNPMLTGTGLCSMPLRGIRDERAKEQSRGRKAFLNLPGKTLAQRKRRRFPLNMRNPIVEQSTGSSTQRLPSGQLFLSESLDPASSPKLLPFPPSHLLLGRDNSWWSVWCLFSDWFPALPPEGCSSLGQRCTYTCKRSERAAGSSCAETRNAEPPWAMPLASLPFPTGWFGCWVYLLLLMLCSPFPPALWAAFVQLLLLLDHWCEPLVEQRGSMFVYLM